MTDRLLTDQADWGRLVLYIGIRSIGQTPETAGATTDQLYAELTKASTNGAYVYESDARAAIDRVLFGAESST